VTDIENLSPEPEAPPVAVAPQANAAKSDVRGAGVPLWMPLVGLLVAFIFAIVVGVQICPTLSAIVLPPDPPLPPGGASMLKHEAKGTGHDEWIYGTNATGCEVARYYETLLGACTYDPDSGCGSGQSRPAPNTGSAQHIAQCYGNLSVGAQVFSWTVYVSTGFADGNRTHFRTIRVVGN
jgi:hypothetical protein